MSTTVTKHILGNVALRVSPQHWPALQKYYCSVLGMTVKQLPPISTLNSESTDARPRFLVSFPGSSKSHIPANTTNALQSLLLSAALEFRLDSQVAADSSFAGSREDLYWKVGIALDDVDAGLEHMEESLGVPHGRLGRGDQFVDVGFLHHVRDPAGFAIELLQTTMEGNEKERRERVEANTATAGSRFFGAKNSASPVLGQITTRASNKEATLKFYTETLGMKLIAIEDVSQYGFELYFLAFTDENPPNPEDLNAVENREWLYQRPYTTLEIQFFKGPGSGTRVVGDKARRDAPGCEGITIYTTGSDSNGEERDLVDPSGLKVSIRRAEVFLGNGKDGKGNVQEDSESSSMNEC